MTDSDIVVVYGKKSSVTTKEIFVSEENFQIPPISIDSTEDSLSFLEQIQNSAISGQTVLELFQYENLSFWWILHPSIFPIIKKTTNFIKKFNEFLDEVNPSTVKIVDDFETHDLISQICKNRNIKLEYSKKSLFNYEIKKKIVFKGQKYRYKKIFQNKNTTRKNLFSLNNDESINLDNKIIFATPTIYRRNLLNLQTGKSEKGEYMSQPIMDYMKSKGKILGIDVDYTFKGDFDVLSERLLSNVPWIPLEFFVNNNYNESKHAKFLENYKKIILSNEFKKLFSFNGISIWNQVYSTVIMMIYTPYFPFYLNLLDSLLEIFSTQKPKVFFLTYETGPIALAIMIAAQRHDIKTIGLAHSSIPKGYAMYSYDPIQSKNNPLGFPFPDNFLVFGNSSKNSLVEQGYPADKITSFGNPAFFNLDDYIKILDNSELRKKYDILENQKTVLFTTEFLQEYHMTHGKYNYDTEILSDLIANFSKNEEFVIILKPHPSENTDVYQKIISENNATNFRIIEENLFELIHVSDIVISVFSNSMTDALCFKKPVIRVTFDDTDHVLPYDKYNVLVSCSLENLSQEIKNIISDQKIQKTLLENRESFVKELYNIPEYNIKSIMEEILKI